MFLLIGLIPATLLTVIGYFVLFSSIRTEGGVKTFGQVLAVWLFVLAAVPVLAGAYATYAGLSPADAMRSMHSGPR
jgi:hypothetical protein